jgi:hypothetical protein
MARTDSQKKLPGDITQEQLDQWIKEHGKDNVKRIDVTVAQGDVATCYIKKPDRNVYALAISMFNQDKVLECGELVMVNCWLGGDTRCKTDDYIAISAAMKAKDAVTFYTATLKNV